MLLLFLGVTIGVSLLLIEYGLTRVLHNTTASTDLLVHQVVAVVVSCQFASVVSVVVVVVVLLLLSSKSESDTPLLFF